MTLPSFFQHCFFLNHFNLISYFISFALCDLNTFPSFDCAILPQSGAMLEILNQDLELQCSMCFGPTKCFDLMTRLNDVKFLAAIPLSRGSECVTLKSKARPAYTLEEPVSRAQWIFKANFWPREGKIKFRPLSASRAGPLAKLYYVLMADILN